VQDKENGCKLCVAKYLSYITLIAKLDEKYSDSG